MYCKNCGAEIADNTKFCAECGASTTQEPASNPNKKRTPWIIVLAILLIVAVSFIVYVLFIQSPSQPPPTQTPVVTQTETPETPTLELTVTPTPTAILSTLTVDTLVVGLDRNITQNIGNIRWESTGINVLANENSALPNGYPREIPVLAGNIVVEFNTQTMTVTQTHFENGIQTAQSQSAFTYSGNTYIEAYQRTQNIDGTDYDIKSVFFISDNILYECESINGIDSTNYIAYTNTGTASTPILVQTQIDQLVAGLDRDIMNGLKNVVWISSGTSVPALANSALPTGYPRTFDVGAEEIQYTFDIQTMTVTLTAYENGSIKSVTTKPFVKINNTYVSSFEEKITADGKQYDSNSIFFISNGTLYECISLDGIDASNYIAYYPVG